MLADCSKELTGIQTGCYDPSYGNSNEPALSNETIQGLSNMAGQSAQGISNSSNNFSNIQNSSITASAPETKFDTIDNQAAAEAQSLSCNAAQSRAQSYKGGSGACASYLTMVHLQSCKDKLLGSGVSEQDYNASFQGAKNVAVQFINAEDDRSLEWAKVCK